MVVVRLGDGRVNSCEGVLFLLVWLIRGWWGVLSVRTTHVWIKVASFCPVETLLDWMPPVSLCPPGLALHGVGLC